MGSDENCLRQIAKVRLSVISIAIQIQWGFETQLYRWAVYSNNRLLEFGNNLKLLLKILKFTIMQKVCWPVYKYIGLLAKHFLHTCIFLGIILYCVCLMTP